MRTSYHVASEEARVPAWRRAVSFLLAVAAHVLVILLLFYLAPSLTPKPVEPEQRVSSFSLSPSADTPATTTQAAKGKPAPAKKTDTPVRPTTPVVPVTPPPPIPVKRPVPPVFLPGGSALFDAADIGKIASSRDDGDSGEAEGSGKDSVAAYGPGEGPGGQRLYNADWVREPTDSELSFYLPHNIQSDDWALIACRTIPGNKVENCRSLGESRPGSGLASGIRQAAWQFRIVPPRINGKRIMGAWVRIRIDFTKRAIGR